METASPRSGKTRLILWSAPGRAEAPLRRPNDARGQPARFSARERSASADRAVAAERRTHYGSASKNDSLASELALKARPRMSMPRMREPGVYPLRDLLGREHPGSKERPQGLATLPHPHHVVVPQAHGNATAASL